MDSLRGKIIIIQTGSAKSVGHKRIRVGVSYTTTSSNYASVSSGEFKDGSMDVGENFSRIVDSKNYTITLVKVGVDYAKFSYDISKNAKIK